MNNLKILIRKKVIETLKENVKIDDDLSTEWTKDIIEYLYAYFGTSRNQKKLFKLIKEVVDKAVNVKSFYSFRDFLDFHNPDYHELKSNGYYKNMWWPTVAYLLGNTETIERDSVDETFMHKVIVIMDYVIDNRQDPD